MLRRIVILVCLGLLILIMKVNVSAEEAPASANATTEEWNPPSAGPISTWTAPLCGKGKFVIQPFVFYNRTRGSFDEKGRYSSLDTGDKKYQYQEQIFMQYGLTDRLELDAQFVYQQNYVKQGELKAHDSGFGDSYMFLRYCGLEENGWMPHITGQVQLKIPTAKFQHLDPNKLGADSMGATSGGGSWDPGLGVNLTKKIKPFIFHTDAIYSFPRGVNVDGVSTHYANYLNYDFGVEYILPKGFNLMLEANGFLQGNRIENGDRVDASGIRYLTVAPGIGWSNDKIQTLFAYQRIVSGKNTDANDSLVLTCVYNF